MKQRPGETFETQCVYVCVCVLRFYLFIHERHREREAETQAEGEAGSTQGASPTWGLIPGLQDHTLG